MNRRSFFTNLLAAAVAPLFTSKAQAPPVVATCPSCGSADCRHANAVLCAIDQQYRRGWLTDRPPFLFNPRTPAPFSINANVTADARSTELATRTGRPAGWTYSPQRRFFASYGDAGDPDDEVVRVVEWWPADRAPFVLLPPLERRW
jgi:hypothetical protein